MHPKNFRPKFIQDSMQEQGKNCIICSKELQKSVKYYCSGECMNKAKEQGTYDNEV